MKRDNYTNYSFAATTGTDATTETAAFQKAPFSAIRAGYYNLSSGGLNVRGSYGYYWSSHAYASTHAHYLGFDASHFTPQNGSSKPNGFTVRCVVR